MTWREDLRRVVIDGQRLVGASFRGVPFFVDGSERSGGRRVVRHSFPFRDDPFVEDLGRKDRSFKVEAYVIGDDYMVKRDALLAALEDVEGPGELVHPFFGVRRAICDDLSLKETKQDGGMAMLSIVFCEAPSAALEPITTIDKADRVSSSATAARKAASAELDEKFTVTGLPSFALTSASSALRTANEFLGSKLAPITTTTQQLAQLNGQVTLISANATALVRTPASVLDDFGGALDVIGDTIAAVPGAVFDALVESYSVEIGPDVPETTDTRRTERINQQEMTAGLRRVMLIEAARIAPSIPFASIDDALIARDTLARLLDEQAALAGDTAYPALVTLRADVLLAVPGSSAFARTIAINRAVAIPSLLLAYELYGSVDQELDIVARNDIPHPGFVSGDLKVLSNA